MERSDLHLLDTNYLIIYYIFGQLQRLTFVGVNFSVMLTDFSHIHSIVSSIHMVLLYSK